MQFRHRRIAHLIASISWPRQVISDEVGAACLQRCMPDLGVAIAADTNTIFAAGTASWISAAAWMPFLCGSAMSIRITSGSAFVL